MGIIRRTKRKLKTRTRTRTRTSRKYTRKYKHTRFYLRGGTLVGQGNYGCVFRPDILTKSNNIVSKIVLKNNIFNEFRHEYKILKKMKTIDPTGKFHSLMSSAFELTKNNLPNDFDKCSLSKPEYKVEEFFVFNMNFCGNINLTTYFKNNTSTSASADDTTAKLAVILTLITNIIVGIYKMIKSNVVHKTLNADSIYLVDPVSLSNPYSLKIIDYGEGELRKYKNHTDSNYDYITFFNNMIQIITELLKNNTSYSNILEPLLQGFKTLLQNVRKLSTSTSTSMSNYKNIITQYCELLGSVFGEKYKKYALAKYKVD